MKSKQITRVFAHVIILAYDDLLLAHLNHGESLWCREPHTFYMCPVCFKKCKSASGPTQHRNSEHREFTPRCLSLRMMLIQMHRALTFILCWQVSLRQWSTKNITNISSKQLHIADDNSPALGPKSLSSIELARVPCESRFIPFVSNRIADVMCFRASTPT